MAWYRTPGQGETRRTAGLPVIGQCGLSTGGGQPAFDPHVVPGVGGPGCAHGIWGKNNDEDVGTDQNWPTLAVWFFSQF